MRRTMNRKLPLLLSVFGCALGVAAGDAAAQAKYNLRWGHYLADSPFIQLEKDYVAAIEKRTNGQVKINITFSEGLGKTTELLMLTSKGAIDMTATAPGYNRSAALLAGVPAAAHVRNEQAGDGRPGQGGQGVSRLQPGDGPGGRGLALPTAAWRVLPERAQPRVHQRGRPQRQEDPQFRRRHSEGLLGDRRGAGDRGADRHL